MKAPLPPNEAQRLETLRGYDVLDTLPEQAFDDLTLLAAQICQAPIAVITLVDETRQWFKSIIGLDAKETPRDVAFCAHSILNPEELLEVRDAQLDPRFADNPLVTAAPYIRFYAGSPLVAADGIALGTLCVIDRVPRELNTEQKTALRALSRTVIAQLELRTTNRRVNEQADERTADLQREILMRRESEEQTRQLLTEKETILNNALVGIVYLKQRHIVSCNRRLEEIFQYEPGELLGESTKRLYDSSEDYDYIGKVAYQTAAEGKNYTTELRLRHKDGSLFWGTLSGRVLDTSQPHEGSIWIYSDITERKMAEQSLISSANKLRESQRLLEAIVEHIPVMVFLKRASDLRFELFNRAGEELLGYSRSDLLGKGNYDLWPKEQGDWFTAADRKVLASKKVTVIPEEPINTASGETRYLNTWKIALRDEDGEPTHLLGISIDISERKQAEEMLRIAAAAFESNESLMITDANRVILRVNQAFTEDTGYTAEEVVGQTPRLLRSGRHKAGFYHAMWEAIHRTGSWQGEIWDRRKNGEIYPKWLTITAVKREDGVVTHYVGSHINIKERKAAEEKIQYLAFYDSLTHLANRRRLMDQLHQALASSARIGREGALLLIDLDNFKSLNDTLGHQVGDLLLQQVAQRLESCVRDGDTVARLGGDEFVVMLENLSEQALEAAAQTKTIGEKILATLSQSSQLGTYEHYGTASIGITLFDGDSQGSDELLKQADIAMYQAKKAGRNTLRFFDPQMQASISARVELEGELRQALAKQQFHLYYQIQVDSSHLPLGAEALIRWLHC